MLSSNNSPLVTTKLSVAEVLLLLEEVSTVHQAQEIVNRYLNEEQWEKIEDEREEIEFPSFESFINAVKSRYFELLSKKKREIAVNIRATTKETQLLGENLTYTKLIALAVADENESRIAIASKRQLCLLYFAVFKTIS